MVVDVRVLFTVVVCWSVFTFQPDTITFNDHHYCFHVVIHQVFMYSPSINKARITFFLSSWCSARFRSQSHYPAVCLLLLPQNLQLILFHMCYEGSQWSVCYPLPFAKIYASEIKKGDSFTSEKYREARPLIQSMLLFHRYLSSLPVNLMPSHTTTSLKVHCRKKIYEKTASVVWKWWE